MEKPPGLKEIALEGGALRFRVPEGWTEARESDGAAAFYDPAMDRGTLRVKLMTFTSEDDLTGRKAFEHLAEMDEEPGQTLEALPDGNALRIHRERGEAGGEETVFQVWLLASIDPPHRMRLAVFSFTMRAREADELPGRRLVEALDREIRAARFSHQVS